MPYKPTAPPCIKSVARGSSFVKDRTPPLQKPVTAVTAVTRLLEMSFEEYGRTNLTVELSVPWMREHLWLVPDKTDVPRLLKSGIKRGCIWTASELSNLYSIEQFDGQDRRTIALLRAHFGIEIESITDWTNGPIPSKGAS